MAVAIVIMLNFVLNMVEAEIESNHGHSAAFVFFEHAEVAFTCIYAVELCLNLYGHWFWVSMSVYFGMYSSATTVVCI